MIDTVAGYLFMPCRDLKNGVLDFRFSRYGFMLTAPRS